jgi:hypothetical protein
MGLARNSRQNPDDKELRYQNPLNKGLSRARLPMGLIVTPSKHHYGFETRRQG